MGSKVIRNITKVFKSATGVLFGRATAGTGRGEELSPATVRTLLSVYSSSQVDTALTAKADLVGGVVPSAQIPAIAITEYLGSVASQAAMLALVGDRGDWCLRSDTGTTWVLSDDDSSLLASWIELNYPTAPVTSVNGETGAVTLSAADVGAAATSHSHAQSDITNLTTDLAAKQATLVSGTNIKTVNSTSLLGSGNITVSATPSGSDTQIQFNDAGVFGGDAQLTFNKTSGLLTVTGAGATGVKIVETLPGSGTSYVRIFDNGTVKINADSGTGTIPLQILYNGTEQFSVSYLGIVAVRAGGALNIGAGLLTLTDASGVARLNTFNELDIRPGGLGGSGTKRVSVISQNAADQPFRIKGASSQSGDLQQWVSSADVVCSTISENGYFTTRKVSAPADGELSASELALWFDNTNGAGKLKIKAKTADGTVVTGEVALA